MKHTLNRKLFATLLAGFVLLLVQGHLLALPPAAQPDCPPQVPDSRTYDNPDPFGVPASITFTTPNLNNPQICPGTEGCCQVVETEGIPDSWTVTGYIEVQFRFTTACDCSGERVPPLVYERFEFTGHPGDIYQRVCYPSDWPSFEIHVDLALRVLDESGARVSWVGQNGVLGPGGSDWDVTCFAPGCTPGFWKNHYPREAGDEKLGTDQDFPWPGGLEPSDDFDVVFGTTTGIGSILDALGAKGGQPKSTIRHCAAALLNAYEANPIIPDAICYSFFFPYMPAQVIGLCNAALPAGNETLKDMLDELNNSMCPGDSTMHWFNTNTGKRICEDPDAIACNPYWDCTAPWIP